MISRRGFLTVCGATVAAAALPGKEAVANKVGDYKLTTTRYVRPGMYIGDTRPCVPEYTYMRKPGLRAFYEYLELLDKHCPCGSSRYDHLTFFDTPSFVVQGRTNIPLEELNAMWDEAMRKAWMPYGTVLNSHQGYGFDDIHLPKSWKYF